MKRTKGPMPISMLAFLAVAAAVTAATASAQNGGTAMSAAEIRACLCLEPRLDAARADIAARRAALKERESQLATLEAEIVKKRAGLDPADSVGQTVLKNLGNQSMYLRRLIQLDLVPALNRTVADYNALAGTYNRDCTTRPRYAVDVEMARKDLVCDQP